MKRDVYLSMKSLEEARNLFFNRFPPSERTGAETVKAEDALGRVTAKSVFAKRSSPEFHLAAMDGVAVQADITYGATDRNPKVLIIGRDAKWINTGQPLQDEFNAVIMVEKIHQLDDKHIEIRSSAFPWQHVRKVGEDIVATQLLFPQDHRIRPGDMGALISAGIFSLDVWERPKVAIIPTGSELISYKEVEKTGTLKKGQFIEYNSLVLSGLVQESEAIPIIYGITSDVEEEIYKTLQKAIESDAHVIVVNAGSSAGSKDYTAHVINQMGEVLVHGVAIMPGKPTILGAVNGKPIVGNPGYVVSAILSFEQFVKPLLYALQGLVPYYRSKVKAALTRDIPSKLGIEEFIRVNVGKVGPRYVATPLARSAGSITTLTQAEGIIRIGSKLEGIPQNHEVDIDLLVDPEELINTVVIIGSHDITIDILADEIRRKGDNIRIASSNVGSLGGLVALRKGTCHVTGSHLLDTETGEYNLSYVKKYLKGLPVSIFNFVLRDQGIIVAKGNPKGIEGIEDLKRDDVKFVNRQSGSGTRVLLDFKLREFGIKPESVNGYEHEEFTHMAVAVDVLSGTVDCGMGIFAAARALGLDFIQLEREQYDLVIPNAILMDSNIQKILEIIQSKDFRDRVVSLGGYEPSKSGKLWMEVEER